MKYKTESLKNYLSLVSPNLMKDNIWVMLCVVNLFGIFTAVSEPFQGFLVALVVPVVAFLDVWAVLILANREKHQKDYILFVGVFSLAVSLILLALVLRDVYYVYGNDSPGFAVYALLGYLAVWGGNTFLNLTALKRGYYTNGNAHKGWRGMQVTMILAVLVAVGGVYLFKVPVNQDGADFLVLLALVLAYLLEAGINNIHKYRLLKQYDNYAS